MSDALPDVAGLSTAALSDALDRIGKAGALHGISPLANGQRLVGRAFTVQYRDAGNPPGTVGDYLDDVGAGQTVVLSNAGRTDCTVWGDILTALAHDRGVSGTVIDGVNRDVRRALDTGYPIYSRGRYMRTGKDRVEVAEVGGTVSIAGIDVSPGDLLVGDDDGLVVLPREVETEVLELARSITERETAILADALSGMTLAEARSRHGYHELQRRQS
jgi:4-hydroxy-4-methyl-2-oxoglutarate aldolase